MDASDLGPLFTGGQYDMLTVDKPEKQRKSRPGAELVPELRILFSNEGDRTLYQVASKLYNEVGTEAAIRGMNALARLPGWSNAIIKYGVKSMTQVTRIVQAAGLTDDNDRPPVDIRLDMGRRQAQLADADQVVVGFLQELHGTHPAMRKYIKSAAESVLKTAFRIDIERAPHLVGVTIEIARKDKARIQKIRDTYQIPKETATWLQQILTRL